MFRYLYYFIIFTSISIFSNNDYIPGFPDYSPTSNITAPLVSTANMYPDVNSSGFVELKLSGRDYTDDLSKLDTIRQDPVYKKIPNEIMRGTPKLENRYNIELEGHLDEDTEIKYSIQKEPDFPGIYNVYIRKKTSELQFGDFNTNYSSGEFVNVEKYLNGVEANTAQDNWKGKVTFGKEKSEPQKFETYGTNSNIYKVGRSFLLEGSVIVYVNNRLLDENVDYTVDYYEGKIIFVEQKDKLDFIKVIYEFTNPIQDFIPSLSRKNFTAAMYTYNPSQNIVVQEPITITKNMSMVIKQQDDVLNNHIVLPNAPIKLGSESIYLNSKLLTRSVHYYLKNDTGLVRFISKQLAFDDTVSATYQHFKTSNANDLIVSKGTPGPYALTHPQPIDHTISVSIDQKKAREFIDYIYKKSSNSVLFYYPIASNRVINISYQYIHLNQKSIGFEQAPFSLELTHLTQSTVVRDSLLSYQNNVQPIQVDGNKITLKDNPIDQNKPVTIEVNGRILDASEYTINYYTGIVTLLSSVSPTMSNVKTSYHYLTSLNSEHSMTGLSIQTYNQEQIQFKSLPLKYNGIKRITVYNPSEVILEEGRDYTISYMDDNSTFMDVGVTFIVGGYSVLNRYPSSSDVIKFDYDYVPDISSSQSDSNHSVTDLRIQKKVNDHWNIYTEIANSNYNYSKTSTPKKQTFTQQQPDNIYVLETNTAIEKDSESIFINGFSQTRDVDYYINYEKAEVRFINKTIPNNQKVEISYNVYQNDTPNQKNVNAYSLESHYKPKNNVSFINKVAIVDPNFLPIGNINLNQGSSQFLHEINWEMNKNERLSFIIEQEEIQNKNYVPMYKKNSYLTKLNFNMFFLQTSHELQFDDVSSTNNYKETPNKVIRYDNTFDYLFSDDTISLSNSVSQKNEAANNNQSLNSFITQSKLTYTNNFSIDNLIQTGAFIPYISLSTDKNNSGGALSYSQKNIQTIGFNSNSNMSSAIQSSTSFDKASHKTTMTTNDQFLDEYYNYSHLTNFTPAPWVNGNINISHEEAISPIPGQENLVEDREGYNITQIANDAFLETLGSPTFLISPFKSSYSNVGISKTKKRENNRLKLYNEDRYFGAINALKPVDGLSIPMVKFDTYQSLLTDSKSNNYQTFSQSKTKFYSYDTGVNYRPNISHLNRFSFDSSFNESNSNSFSTLSLTSGTENITLSTVYNQTQMMGVNVNGPSIPLWLTKITSPTLRIEQSRKRKKDENTTTSNDPTNDTLVIDNSIITLQKGTLKYNAFKQVKFMNNVLHEASYFNRNKIAANSGALYRLVDTVDQSIEYSLFRSLQNKEYLKYETINEFKSNDINIPESSLSISPDTHLNLIERIANHESKLSLNRLFTLKGELEYQDFNQRVSSSNALIKEEFLNQNSGTAGLIFQPLSGLKIIYDYTIKQLRKNNETSTNGNSDLIKITYNPIKYENMEIQFDLSREKNWGFGFNSIQKAQLFQTSNESLSIQIVPRNDEVYLGSLNLSVTIPIQNSEHLERLIVSGEGYYKRIIDRVDSKNTMMINGLLFNVRLEL